MHRSIGEFIFRQSNAAYTPFTNLRIWLDSYRWNVLGDLYVTQFEATYGVHLLT